MAALLGFFGRAILEARGKHDLTILVSFLDSFDCTGAESCVLKLVEYAKLGLGGGSERNPFACRGSSDGESADAHDLVNIRIYFTCDVHIEMRIEYIAMDVGKGSRRRLILKWKSCHVSSFWLRWSLVTRYVQHSARETTV